jgi:predicted acyltransferase
MDDAANRPAPELKDRLLSLDVFRGLTMFLLIGESTLLYERLRDPSLQGTLLHAIGTQLDHHPWAGLRFWDLVQPFFMFIVGTALALSVSKRERRGDPRRRTTRHVLVRALLLLLIGWSLYCIGPGRITFRFQNVLAQLSVTTVIAYAVMRRPAREQVALSLGLIVLSETLYRVFWAPGFNQPFVPDRNFGAWVDMRISGELSAGHWVSFNAVPTAVHTIWGVLAGRLLMSGRPPREKIRVLSAAGLAAAAAGFALTPLSPMIKRICTASFVVASGGLCLLALAASYWLIDVRGARRWTWFFNGVGVNSLFIYIFTETGATAWLSSLAKPFTQAVFGWTGKLGAEIATSLAAWALLWSLCYWLYRRRILIKI